MPFEDAVDVWARTFAALGIRYRGATMNLDLLDREMKYSNGFCHWPQPAYFTTSGEWVPSSTNFTSLASPGAVGSGKTALVTLLHEGEGSLLFGGGEGSTAQEMVLLIPAAAKRPYRRCKRLGRPAGCQPLTTLPTPPHAAVPCLAVQAATRLISPTSCSGAHSSGIRSGLAIASGSILCSP